MSWINVKEYGVLPDTPENRKIEPERKKKVPCIDCGKHNFTIVRETYVADNSSIFISGTAPPVGSILKMSYYNNNVRCSKCQKKYDAEVDYYDDE